MEEKTVSSGKISVNYGLVAALGAIAFTMVVDIAGMMGNQAIQYLWYVILIVIVVLAHREFKNKGDGYMNYGQGLGIAVLISLISSVISSIFFYFYITAINKNFIANMLRIQKEKLVEGGMYGAELDKTMEATESFMSPVIMTLFGLIGGFVISVIVCLIVTAITQKKRPENLA
ncbi:MAG: DUF4199 domain-containing protein [Cyclobacteriaceae bacterium]